MQIDIYSQLLTDTIKLAEYADWQNQVHGYEQYTGKEYRVELTWQIQPQHPSNDSDQKHL